MRTKNQVVLTFVIAVVAALLTCMMVSKRNLHPKQAATRMAGKNIVRSVSVVIPASGASPNTNAAPAGQTGAH